MSNIDDYVNLRDQVIDQIIPLLDHDEIAPRDKFELCLQIARLRGSYELFQKALEVSHSLPAGEKVGALMDLLGDIDLEVQDQTLEESEQPERPLLAEEAVSNEG